MHFIQNSQLTLILYTLQLSRNLASPSCALITLVGLSMRVLDPNLPNRSSLTERTSDNQRLGASNDTTSVTLKSQLD